ncbi:hypothetical protein CLOP_g22402 [Closterium sp. NIES-67]|nr:hypothetical protein CLOP_g22402 [Closterium sp. NIES-67]
MATKRLSISVLLLPLFVALLLNTFPAATALPVRRSLLGRLLKPLLTHVGLGSTAALQGSTTTSSVAAWRDVYRRQLISRIEPTDDKNLVLPPAAKTRVTESISTGSIAAPAAAVTATTATPSTNKNSPVSATAATPNANAALKRASRTAPKKSASEKTTTQKNATAESATEKITVSRVLPQATVSQKRLPIRRSVLSDMAPASAPAPVPTAPRRRMMRRSLRHQLRRRSALSDMPASAPTAPPPTAASGRQLRRQLRRSMMASAPASQPSVRGRFMLESHGDDHHHAPRDQALSSAPCPEGPQEPPRGEDFAPFPLECWNPKPSACDLAFDGSTDEIPTITLPSLVTDAPLDITPSEIVSIVGGTLAEVAEAKGNSSALVCADVPRFDGIAQVPDGVFEIRGPSELVYNGQLMKSYFENGENDQWVNAFRSGAAREDGALVRVQIGSATLNVFGAEVKVGMDDKNTPSGSELSNRNFPDISPGPFADESDGASSAGGSDASDGAADDLGEDEILTTNSDDLLAAPEGGRYLPYERRCVLFRVKSA